MKNVFSIPVLLLFAFLPSLSGCFRLDSVSCTNSSDSVFLQRDLYELCFNKIRKQPSWVLQVINKGAFERPQDESPKNYYPDLDIPKEDQASERDYQNSFWVMGTFLFPFTKQDEQLSGESACDQYLFSVTSPQNPDFHKGYWRKLRNRVKALSAKKEWSLNNHIAVLSGPLFLSKSQSTEDRFLGHSHIPVPTHFFQVIASSQNLESFEVYIVPNEKIDENTPLSDFKVSLDEFEKKSGIKGTKTITQYLPVPVPFP